MSKEVVKKVLTANEKIILLLKEIEEFKQITPSNEPIRIPCYKLSQKGLDNNFVHTFLKKLNNDLKIIKIIHLGEHHTIFVTTTNTYTNPDENNIVLELQDGFDEYYNKIIKNNLANNDKSLDKQEKEFELKITYSEHSREIIVNNFFLIAKPDFESENERVFYYLYQNPNRSVPRSEIEENFNGNKTLTKSFSKILENLNFKKDLKDVFFDVSKNAIQFHNPVSKERLGALGIKKIPIQVK